MTIHQPRPFAEIMAGVPELPDTEFITQTFAEQILGQRRARRMVRDGLLGTVVRLPGHRSRLLYARYVERALGRPITARDLEVAGAKFAKSREYRTTWQRQQRAVV
jgi:hypothetical protein